MFSLVFFSFFSSITAFTALEDWQQSRATFYDGWDSGNCGYGTIPSDVFPTQFIAAPNTAFYANGAKCGECYEVQCVSPKVQCSPGCLNTSVVIQITDQCPAAGNAEWCSGDITHFDLSRPAFTKIANPTCGVINTKIRRVTCDVSGNIKIKIKNQVNNWWFAFFVQNIGAKGKLDSVEVQDTATNWTKATIDSNGNNFWLVQSGSGFKSPLSIRITSEGGLETLTFTNIIPSIPQNSDTMPIYDTSKQFMVASSASTTTTTYLKICLLLISIIAFFRND